MYFCKTKRDFLLGAGQRHSVTLQTLSESRSATGAVTNTWANLCSKRASIEPLQGREYWNGNQALADQRFIIKMSYDTTAVTITPKGRILFGSRIFDIETKTNPDEANKELHFICKEQV